MRQIILQLLFKLLNILINDTNTKEALVVFAEQVAKSTDNKYDDAIVEYVKKL